VKLALAGAEKLKGSAPRKITQCTFSQNGSGGWLFAEFALSCPSDGLCVLHSLDTLYDDLKNTLSVAPAMAWNNGLGDGLVSDVTDSYRKSWYWNHLIWNPALWVWSEWYQHYHYLLQGLSLWIDSFDGFRSIRGEYKMHVNSGAFSINQVSGWESVLAVSNIVTEHNVCLSHTNQYHRCNFVGTFRMFIRKYSPYLQ